MINIKKYIENNLMIKDKVGNLVPFQLNEPQIKLYNAIKRQQEKKVPVRIIILKARQMGFSTLTEGIGFTLAINNMNYRFGIITHKDEATNNLFNMSQTFYYNLQKELMPTEEKNNARELIFDTKDKKGLGSRIKCMTAGSKGVGRSDTYHFLHISEYAFWEGNKKKTLQGLLQAVPNSQNTFVIIESTANGYEDFKELWDSSFNVSDDELGGFVPVFFAWFELDSYRMKYTGFQLTPEEKELKQLYGLDNEQIAWRRWCIRVNFAGDEEMFRQEYPSNPHEAFISTGQCVFDKEQIIDRLNVVEKIKPLKQGMFSYDYNGTEISNIRFIEDPNGYIKIYKNPEHGHPYVIGGDTAGEGSDFFAGQVIDNSTGVQVASLRQQFDEDLYAIQMYCLGFYYNNALIGLETNFSTFPVKELQRLDYPNLYVRETEDTFTGKVQRSYGFRTTTRTRPIIIADLIKVVRENIESFIDKQTLEEMLTFVKNSQGKPEAINGKFDDMVMAMAITYYIRNQQRFTVDKLQKTKKTVDELFLEHFKKKENTERDDYIVWG